MGERAEAAVGHQDIARQEQGEDPGDAGHVMRPQRRGENLQQQPGAGVEQHQDVGHREAAAFGFWLPGWPKWAWSSGVSGMENDEPSTRKVRWPSHRPTASVSGTRALTNPRGRSGRRPAAAGCGPGNRPEAVKARPANKRDVVKAVLPWRTWMRNQ